mmetsp:Transcript_10850/g.18493  ORF Transcript_10850/g.18493 Transcript_10850/m.18493 type:complete len:134 (+) Transcript_10850:3-404(+)
MAEGSKSAPAKGVVKTESAGAGGGDAEEDRKRPRPASLLDGEEIIRAGTIRRIMKVPSEVKMTGSEAVHLVCKATELFVSEIVDRSVARAAEDGRKVVRYSDVADCVKDSPNLETFVELLPDLATLCNNPNVP